MRATQLTASFCMATFVCIAPLAWIGCAERTPAPASAPSPAPAGAPPAPAANVAAARAAVTGVLLRREDHVEICPGESVGPCPGIRVEGKVEDAWISEPGKVAVWRLTGLYDGTKLVLDAPAQPTTRATEADYRNNCPEFQQLRNGVNPDPALAEKLGAFVTEHAERVAGSWWDRERQTMVVWVTGDPSDVRSQIAKRAPGARVCVQGQARYSEAELERLRAKADVILRERGVTWSGSGGYVTRNAIVYDADAIDAETLAQLKRDTGDAVVVEAFVELLDRTLEQSPQPAARGDVALMTSRSRSGGGMSALGRFTVHYDAALRCVYFSADGQRTLPVWPFGYWATSSPFKVYDYDDKLVAQEGAALELGGGMVEVEHVRAANACGAKHAWIGRPQDPSPGLRR